MKTKKVQIRLRGGPADGTLVDESFFHWHFDEIGTMHRYIMRSDLYLEYDGMVYPEQRKRKVTMIRRSKASRKSARAPYQLDLPHNM